MCTNNFIVFSFCCGRKFSVTDDKVSVGANSVPAHTSLHSQTLSVVQQEHSPSVVDAGNRET